MHPRPKTTILGLAVLAVLLGGCQNGEAAPVTPATATVPPSAQLTQPASPTASPSPTAQVSALPTPGVAKLKPAVTAKPAAKPAANPTPRPKPTTKRPVVKATTKGPSGEQGVHPGAFCSPEGATGRTSKGTAMRCTRKAGEDRARWRAA
jgi:hypothetical protein